MNQQLYVHCKAPRPRPRLVLVLQTTLYQVEIRGGLPFGAASGNPFPEREVEPVGLALWCDSENDKFDRSGCSVESLAALHSQEALIQVLA